MKPASGEQSPPITRAKYNAIRKAEEVAEMLAERFSERIKALCKVGLNQTQIARALADEDLAPTDYGTFKVLRSATSAAIRLLLPPDVAAHRRVQAWRDSMKALSDSVKADGRKKGRERTQELYGWKQDEEELLLIVATQHLHPVGSRYEGKVDWNAVTTVMHGAAGGFQQRDPSAYKQRYSLLKKAAAGGEEAL